MNQITNLHEQINRSCRFCTPPEKERILFETENFYVMVSLGPIVEGYLLIVTKQHIGACLNIPLHLITEFLALKDLVRKILISHYGSCIFFEHGKIGSSLKFSDSNTHCYHAHLHCVPVSISMNQIICKEHLYKEFYSFHDAQNELIGVDKYLLVEDDSIHVYFPEKPIEKQYLRKVLSKSIGNNEKWNWVEFQGWNIINDTIIHLKSYFDEKYHFNI